MNASLKQKPKHERVADLLATCAITWFVLALFWGVGGAHGAGHYQTMSGTGITAENMWRFHILGPVWSYTHTPPSPSEYYCHHPWGLFWLAAIFVKVLGHHHYAVVLPAILMSITTAILLHRIARRAWGAWPAAAAAFGFTLTPISIAFGNLQGLEVITMFGAAVFFHGTLRYFESQKKRFLVEALIGVFFTTSGDWPGYLVLAIVLGVEFVRLVLPTRTTINALRAHTRWWVLSVVLSAFMLLFWVYQFNKAGKLADWLSSGDARASGSAIPLKDVLAARAYWIESAFTPMVIALGKVAAVIIPIRAIATRKPFEFFSLAVLVAATIQYVVFKNGADIHYFWPHYFVLYYALAIAQLVATIGWLFGAIVSRWNARVGRNVTIAVAAAATLAPALALVPDAPRVLRYARATGGRFNENGNFIRDEYDTLQVARWISSEIAPDAALLVDTSNTSWGWHGAWNLNRVSIIAPLPEVGKASNASTPWWLARTSLLTQGALTSVMTRARPLVIDDLILVDTRVGAGPLLGYRIEEREPNLLEWYFISGVQPIRRIRESEFVTWEWRVHFDQIFEYPKAEPKDLEELRIAHNVAIHQGNAPKATDLRNRIEAELDRASATPFSGGHQLLGVRLTGKANRKLETWFSSNGPLESNAYFQVRSVVDSPYKLSLIPRDPTERDCGIPPSLPTTLWRVGFIYRYDCPLLHRFGLEHFSGAWVSRNAGKPAPARPDGAKRTMLVSIY